MYIYIYIYVYIYMFMYSHRHTHTHKLAFSESLVEFVYGSMRTCTNEYKHTHAHTYTLKVSLSHAHTEDNRLVTIPTALQGWEGLPMRTSGIEPN